MTVLTREELDAPDPLEAEIERPAGPTVGDGLRWLLAIASAGAAVVHFAYSSAHFSEYWLYGLFFVVVAWLQLLWAAAIVRRGRRWLLGAAVVLNASVVAVWIASRTIGVWIGPNATVKEAATYPDILCTVLEALIAIGSIVVLSRWGGARRIIGRSTVAGAAVVGLLVITATSGYALRPEYAAGHAHGSTAGAHAHGAAGAALTGDTPCEKAGPPASEGQVLDSSGHFHRGPRAQIPIDEATRVRLEDQQVAARTVVDRYPTVADAEAAGYRESTVYVPCIGAHYTNVGLATTFDPAAPSELLYDGTQPNSRLVGLSYLVWHPGGAPEGFAGPNDVWHQHTFNGGLCVNAGGLVIGSESIGAAQCAARGGTKVPLTDVWMLHDWVVPGFECSWGVFAPECPELGGRIGGTAWDPPDPRSAAAAGAGL